MERIAFDLDGTLYDTFTLSLRAENTVLRRYGYQPISASELRGSFQSKDYQRYYRGLGVEDKDIGNLIRDFFPVFDSVGLPELIPGAREVLTAAEGLLGEENIFFVTNATSPNLEARFHRDGLYNYLSQVRNSHQGKAELLLALATQQESKLTYVGDLVYDGEECLAARERGAGMLYFYGLTHEYAYSLPEEMQRFVGEHSDFARAVGSLEGLQMVLTTK